MKTQKNHGFRKLEPADSSRPAPIVVLKLVPTVKERRKNVDIRTIGIIPVCNEKQRYQRPIQKKARKFF